MIMDTLGYLKQDTTPTGDVEYVVNILHSVNLALSPGTQEPGTLQHTK